MIWENNVFQRMEVILTLYGLESSVFFVRIDVLLIKYGHASIDFFVKYWIKDHLIDFFRPYNRVELAELIFFDQVWVWQQGVFHEKFEINDSCFCEKGRFLTKYGHDSIVFLRERTLSVTNGHQSNNF